MAVWQEKRFDSFIKLNRGFDLPDKYIINGVYPVVASTNIKAYHISYKVEAPVVTTGRSGSLGTVQYINKKCTPLNTTLYVKDYKGNFPKFVYYFLQMMHLEQFNSGTGVPTLNQNHLHSYKLLVPDLATQEKIADILSTYDDLIENNNRRIEILEQMAQEIYKEWFIRFRFPGHEKVKFINGLPEGWEVKKIKDIVDRKPFGTLYKESQVQEDGKVIVIDQSKKDYIGFHNNEPSHNADIEKPMILFGDHSCKYKIMIKPFSLAENVIPFISNNENLLTTYYLFYSINSIVQTTEYKRHWTDLTNKKIIISNINLQTKFEEKIKEFLLEIEQLSIINRNLIKQRDLLLPRLMSGKLEV